MHALVLAPVCLVVHVSVLVGMYAHACAGWVWGACEFAVACVSVRECVFECWCVVVCGCVGCVVVCVWKCGLGVCG